MKKSLTVCLLLAAVVAPTWADFEWPAERVPVRIDGQQVDVVWRDGRPFVEREKVMNVLHVRTGDHVLDLAQVLQAKGYTLTLNKDGSVDARMTSTPSANVSDSVAVGPVRKAPERSVSPIRVSPTTSQADQFQKEFQDKEHQKLMAPRLVASGHRYEIDTPANTEIVTKYIRAHVVIENQGGSASKPCLAIGEFVDWYEHPFARDSHSLPRLKPGESVEVTFFCVIDDENLPGGVKADKCTCQIKFTGTTDAANTGATKSKGKYAGKGGNLNFHINSSTFKFTPGNDTGTNRGNSGGQGIPGSPRP